MHHDFAYTFSVIDCLLQNDTSEIIRFKSDNCSTQYKCKWVFKQWQSIAVRKGKRVIVYYGASGHGKGLVDAMSGFGVKGPLRKAVITSDLHFTNAAEICNYLDELFKDDNKKHYYLFHKMISWKKESRKQPW